MAYLFKHPSVSPLYPREKSLHLSVAYEAQPARLLPTWVYPVSPTLLLH